MSDDVCTVAGYIRLSPQLAAEHEHYARTRAERDKLAMDELAAVYAREASPMPETAPENVIAYRARA